MTAIKRILVFTIYALLCAAVAQAQDLQRKANGETGSAQEVTIIIQQRQVRFISQKAGEEMRLQVFDQNGAVVFDSGIVASTEVDWPLLAANGEEFKSGLYAYTLSTREAGAAETRLRRGHFIVDRAKDRDGADKLWVTSQNENGVGAELTVAKDEVTTIAGAPIGERTVGQRTETAGREVADRTVEAEAKSQSLSQSITDKGLGAPVAAVTSGINGRIAKYTSSTDIGNSVMTELNGNIGIGTTAPTNKLHIYNSVSGTTAIYSVSETGPGVWGKSTGSKGIYGESDGNAGVWGNSNSGPGVVGASTNGYGVQGASASLNGFSGYFTNTGGGHGVFSDSPTGRAFWGKTYSSHGVVGESVEGVGVWGISANATGVTGSSAAGWGVYGTSAGRDGYAGYFANTGGGHGVYSESPTGRAFWGKTYSSHGVVGESVEGVGVWGISANATGVTGSSSSGWGVYGISENVSGVGGYFKNEGGGIALKAEGKASVGVLEITGGSDFAENFDVNTGNSPASEIQPGMVVAIDPASPGKLNLSRRAYDRRVAGVISGANGVKPGMTMGQTQTLANGKYPVALGGRVFVRVDATRGAIHPGDLLTTSATPGHAMKAVAPARAQGAIIGKAMTGLKSGKGLVLVLVALQ